MDIKLVSVQWQFNLETGNDYIIVKGFYENCDATKPVIGQITFNNSEWLWKEFQKLAPVMYYSGSEGQELIKYINQYVKNLFE